MISVRNSILIWSLVCGYVHGEPTSQPTTQAAATSQPALDPKVESILDRLEAKGKDVKDLQANIEYIKEDPVLDDTQKYTGILRFKDEQPNPRFFIRFDKLVHEVVSTSKEWHVFDGENYIEAHESIKTKNKHPVVKPGKKVEVFRLGRGPFPLPFGQKKSDIIENFSVKLVPPVKDDPADTDHLECTPLAGTELEKKYKTIHFYIRKGEDLPVKVTTVQKEGEKITAIFTNTKTNSGLPGSDLNLPPETKNYKELEEGDK